MGAENPTPHEKRDAFDMTPHEIRNEQLRHLARHPVPDKDEIEEIISTAQGPFRRRVEELRPDMQSGQPDKMLRAKDLAVLERSVVSHDPDHKVLLTQPAPAEEVTTPLSSLQELYPTDPVEKARVDNAFVRVLELLRIPDMKLAAEKIWDGLRDPGKRQQAMQQLDQLEPIRVRRDE